MFDRMSSQFESEFGGRGGRGIAVDVEDQGEEFVVTADVPGTSREDVNVELADETLRISAEYESETRSGEEGRYIRQERRQETVSRSVHLPEPVDADAVSANYSNGVLTVTLPKRSGSGDSHRIDIE